MRHLTEKILGLAGIILLASASYSIAQIDENDDLYFNSGDRVVAYKPKEVVPVKLKKDQIEQEYSNNPQESYSAKNVNPDFLARYSAQPGQQTAESEGTPEYFDEDYRAPNNNNFVPTNATNFGPGWNDPYNHWGWNNPRFNGWNTWNNPRFNRWNAWNDPFWGYGPRGPGWNTSLGFGTGWGGGWNTAWSIGFGNAWGWGAPGWGWGAPGFYDPFFDPFFWGPGYASAFWGPNWGWGGGLWCPPGFYRPPVIVLPEGSVANGRYYTGQRTSRGSTVRAGSESLRGVNRSTGAVTQSASPTNGRVSNRGTRDFEDAQSRYFTRSRSSRSNNASVTNANSRTSSANYDRSGRNSSTKRYATRSRTDYSNRTSNSSGSSGYNRSSSYNNSNRRSYNRSSSSYNRSRSSGYNNSGYRSSGSRSSSFSTGGSRSRSSSSFSSPSRSRSSSSSGSRRRN